MKKGKKIGLIVLGVVGLYLVVVLGIAFFPKSAVGYYQGDIANPTARLWIKPDGGFTVYEKNGSSVTETASGTYEMEGSKINFHLAGQVYQGRFGQADAGSSMLSGNTKVDVSAASAIHTSISPNGIQTKEVQYIRRGDTKDE